MLGTKRGRSRRLPTPPTPREVVSLHSSPKQANYNPTRNTQHPKTQKKVFEVAQWCDEETTGSTTGRPTGI